ncbi:MAG: HAD family hydrolase [Actinobacteria bacterium]|nr:HAD family hydrolase [Actinomycetota bacterium]
MDISTYGVIFDVDGTLVDTNYLHTVAWARAVRDAGEVAPMYRIHRLIGMGSDQLVEKLLGHPSEAASDGHTRHFEKLMAEIQAFPSSKDLLEEVHRRGAKVVLATSASQDQLNAMLEELAVPDGVIGHMTNKENVEQSKPAPDIFSAALEGAGLEPEQAIVVGDTVWDIEAASQSGLRVIGVLTGGTTRHQLEEAGAVAVYDDPADLLAHLDDSPIGQLLSG